MRTIIVSLKDRLLCESLSQSSKALGLNVIHTCTNGKQALEVILKERPDFAIIGSHLPFLDGFEVVEKLQESGVSTQSILYLDGQKNALMRKAFAVNADAILFPEDGILELSMCFENTPKVTTSHRSTTTDIGTIQSDSAQELMTILTPSQIRILALISNHLTMPQIADQLYISKHTVNNHLANIRRRLNITGRGAILKYALENKHRLIELSSRPSISKDYNYLLYTH